MSAVLVQQALIRRFLAMPTTKPKVLPNHAGDITGAAYVVQVSGTAQGTLGISRLTDVTAEIAIRVDTPENRYATESDAMVDALVSWFAVGSQFDGVTVTEAPSPRPPYNANGVYSVPVLVRGRGQF